MAVNEDLRAARDPDPYDDEPEEEFEEEESPRRRSGRALPIIVASLAIVGFTVIVYYAYQQGIRAGSEQNPPLIKADDSPVKVRPAAPGGMEVPNQNMKVYELGKPGTQQAAAGVERILPKPEEPMQRPAPPAVASVPLPAQDSQAQVSEGSTPQLPVASGASGQPAVNVPAPPPLPGSGQTMSAPVATGDAQPAQPRAGGPAVPTPPAPPTPPRDGSAAQQPAPSKGGLTFGGVAQRAAGSPVPVAPQPQQAAQPPGQPAAQQAAAPSQPAAAPAPAKATPASAPASGSAKVQLGAPNTKDGAEKAAKGMATKYADLLGSMSYEIETHTDTRGTFYRIVFGPLGSKADAVKLCDDLKARNQGCLPR